MEDGTLRKFTETWTDDDNQVRRRCSWSTGTDGRYQAEIVDYGEVLEVSLEPPSLQLV